MHSGENEEQILQRLKQGDESALRELIHQYRPGMLLEAYYILRDMEEAEDIVQEVWIRFWDLRQRVEMKPSLAAYLHRAVRYESIIKVKKDKTRGKREDQYNYFVEPTYHIKPFEDEELRKRLEQAIEEIPPAMRRSFMLSYMEDLSQKEVAAEQGISLQVVKNNVSKALKLLRQKLQAAK